jgi:hypothetical protein
MTDSGRFKVAQKTTLAMHALMRRMNPRNNTYLSEYNYAVHERTTADLMTKVKPDGGTNTHLALDWLIRKLEDSGPALAYLITDGEPNYVDEAVNSAKRFQQHPHLKLRIFLIDGNIRTEKIVRLIGRAAGPETKVIPVSNYQLAGGAIRDISTAINGMYDIGSF